MTHCRSQEDWSIKPGYDDIEPEIVKTSITHNLGPHTYIAWVFEGEIGNGAWWFLDDVYVDDASTHPRPTGLDAINIGFTSADLTWTSYSGLSEIEWMPEAYSPGFGTKVTDATSPLHVSGFENETTYKFYVRDDWGGGDYSPWEGPFSFTTTSPCADGTTSEYEPCGTAVNNTCETATPIYDGITICGTTWYTGLKGDFDEFKLELESGYKKVTMTVTSETGILFGLEQQFIAGSQDCEDLFYNVYPYIWTQIPGTNTLEVLLDNPGTYFFRIQQAIWVLDECPGSKYTATWSVEQLIPPTPDISPPSFAAIVYPNGSTQDNLVMKNSGDFPFEYHAKIIPTNTVLCYPQAANYWTGSCTQAEKTQASMISRAGNEIGWAKFDVSSIPWDARITGIKFHGYLTDYNGPAWYLTSIHGIDPVTALPGDIYDSITIHYDYNYVYSYNNDTILPAGNLSRTLSASAVTDLQAALFKGWFAMGLLNSNYSHYTQFEGWAEAHPPFLEISYIPNGWVTLRDSVYISGTVPPNSIVNVQVNFNAGGMSAGQYSTEINLNTNIDGERILPVTMNVEECITCPPGSVQENEYYGEDVNGGCNMPYGTEVFTQVENGVTICGNTWCDGYFRDTDWFELVLDVGWNRVTVETWAGTDLVVGLIEQTVPGIAGCGNITGNFMTYVEVSACGSGTLEIFLENPGTYYFFIGQSIWNMSYLGTPYYTTWTVEPLDPPVAEINPYSFVKDMEPNEVVQDNLNVKNSGGFPLKCQTFIAYPDSGAGTSFCYPQSGNYQTGSCDNYDKWQVSLIEGAGTTTGWAKFDVSAIPENSTIFDVKFHEYLEDNIWPYWSITPLDTIDPVTAGALAINNYISTHYQETVAYSYNRESGGLPLGWLSRSLGNTAIADLQTALKKGWFAIGVVDFDFDYSYGVIFQGWAEAHPPYLEVSYAANPVNWLTIDGGSMVYDVVTAGNTRTINVGFDAAGVPAGSYSASMYLWTNEAGNPLYYLPVTMNVGFQQILNIPSGWSGVSSYVNPMNKGVEGIFAPYSTDLIILSSMTQFYYPEAGINTIGNWSYETGYKIKAANEFEVTMIGTKISDPSIYLAAGWNLIPVLSSCEVPVVNVFDGFAGLTIVKQVAGPYIYWPAYNINTLQSLVPGKAYFAATASPGTVTYPGCTKSSSTKWQDEKPVNFTLWNNPHYSASSHAIAFPAEVLANSGIKPGDFIGVFTPEGICAGFTEITEPSSNAALVCFSNDETTPGKDGFEAGEMFHFKLFKPKTNEEKDLEVTYDPALPNTGLFENQGLSAVKSITLNPAEMLENTDINCDVFPNPSHGNFTLTMSCWPEKLQISVIDIKGQVIREFEHGKKLDGSSFVINLTDLPKGIYFLKLSGDGLFEMKKIVID